MPRKKETPEGFDKLLEQWQPPQTAGAPIGCIATSFTFKHEFFEKECLGRFLNLQFDPDEDGPVYLIEREEKLRGITCAAALVDYSNCCGNRNLYWELIPIRVPHSIMHAKVSLLFWQGHVRIIVGSANLTDDGYCRNQEIFGVLDYANGTDAPRSALRDTISFIRKSLEFAVCSGEKSPARVRVNDLLVRIEKDSQNWGADTPDLDRTGVSIYCIATVPKEKNILDQLSEKWPASSPPFGAYIVSPFFDDDIKTNPAVHIWKHLRQRGGAEVVYTVAGNDELDANVVHLQAPQVIEEQTPKNRPDTLTDFLYYNGKDFKDPNILRPLHAKALWLTDKDWALYMVGSSNFTAAGYGFSKEPNLEFNLAYLVSKERNPDGYKPIYNAWISSQEIGKDREKVFEPRQDEETDRALTSVSLPESFGDAIYECSDVTHPNLHLTFQSVPNGKWSVYYKIVTQNKLILDSEQWTRMGNPLECIISWSEIAHIPSCLEVHLDGQQLPAWWPVILRSHNDLPPPDVLRDLPLELLIQILTSSIPVSQVVARWMKKHGGKIKADTLDDTVVVDSHANDRRQLYLRPSDNYT